MILLYTDFGWQGPYVGQMHSVIRQRTPDTSVIDLMHDAPAFKPLAAGRLLAALARHFPAKSVCIAVIDPGVGSERRPVAVRYQDHWFVGPDNGLFEYLGSSASPAQWFEITWRPDALSNSFHGRDLFAPIGAELALDQAGRYLQSIPTPPPLPADLAEVIYVDHYGNAMSGLSADSLDKNQSISVAGQSFHYARTFSEVDIDQAFWTVNSLGLVEIAVNQGSAANRFNLQIGSALF